MPLASYCFLRWQGHNGSCQWSLLGNAVFCKWQAHREAKGATLGACHFIVTWMSLWLSLTYTFLFFPPLCLILSFFSTSPFTLLSLFFANQGSEKGWSDYCRTAEEDSEQLESPRFSQQEWPSTCLKKMDPTNENHQRPICWSASTDCVCYSHLAQWLRIQTENGGKMWHDSSDVFHHFIWKMSWQRSGNKVSSALAAR